MKEIFVNIDDVNENYIDTTQGDNGSEIYKIYILKNKLRVDLTGKIAVLAYVKRSNARTSNITSLDITNPKNGEITLPINNLLTRENGVYACQIAIYGDNKYLEQTASFTMVVKNNVFTDIANALLESSEFDVLNEALKTVSTYEDRLKKGTDEVELQYATKLLAVDKKIDQVATKGTTVEVIEKATKEEIERQIQDGTLANLTIKDGSITKEKLSKDIEFGVKDHSITRNKLNEDVYKEAMLYEVSGQYNSSNWIEITLKNSSIVSIGKQLSLSFKSHGFAGIQSGTTGVYSDGTVYTNEFDTVDKEEISQTLTFNKEYPAKDIRIIFHPKNVTDPNSFILENLEITGYEITKVGVFQKQYPFKKMKYYDDTLITRKDVDKKFDNFVLPKESVSKENLMNGCVDSDIVKKQSLTSENFNPISSSKFNGIHVTKKPSFLSYCIKLDEPIQTSDKIKIQLIIKDNTKVYESSDYYEWYNTLNLSFWGDGIDSDSSNTSSSSLTFDKLSYVINEDRTFKTLTTNTISPTKQISNKYLRLYGTVDMPKSTYMLDTYIQLKIFKNGIELPIVDKGIYNSPLGECTQVDYFDNQLINAKALLDEVRASKEQAIKEAIARTLIENCWLYKKRWGILGDSLSDPGHPQSESVYWLKISQKYKMEVDKQAKSGASTSNGHGTASQVEKLSGDFDLITVWIGTNDANPEATKENGYANNFKTNIENLIKRIYERFPTTKIFFITPLANMKTEAPSTQTLDKGVILYVNAIKEVCYRYSIPVLDMYANSNLNPHMGNINQTFYADADKCHMNTEGYLERINPLIEQFLINQR